MAREGSTKLEFTKSHQTQLTINMRVTGINRLNFGKFETWNSGFIFAVKYFDGGVSRDLAFRVKVPGRCGA